MGKEEVKLSLPDIKTFCNTSTSIIKTVWNWCTNWKIDWLKRKESAESDPDAYGNVYDKGSILDHWDKDGLLNEWCWDNWVAIWKKIKLASYFKP